VRHPYRWTILGAGTISQSSFAAISVGLPALAPALRSHYRLSLGETGVVLAAVGIGMVLTLLAWGMLADRIGERAVIAIGMTGCGAATAATAATGTYPALVGMLILAGALGASVNAASGRAVMGWFDAQERGLALGIRQTAIPIGGAAAAVALPWLASAGGTGLAFEVLGATCAAGGVVSVVLLCEAPIHEPHAAADARRPLRDKRMWLLAGGSSLYLTAQIATMTYVVLFLHEHRGLSIHAAAGVLAFTNVLGIGARIGAGRWSDHVRARLAPLRLVGLVLTVGMLAAAALVDAPLAVLVPALVAAGVLGLTWNGLAFTAAAERSGTARSGAALGFQQTMLGVATAAITPTFAVVAATSWRTAFALSALGPLVGVLLLRRVPEPMPRAFARTPGTSASPPAAP
jgi:sugar phosphate permease